MTRVKFMPNETKRSGRTKITECNRKTARMVHMQIMFGEANCVSVHVLGCDDNKRVPLPSPWRDY